MNFGNDFVLNLGCGEDIIDKKSDVSGGDRGALIASAVECNDGKMDLKQVKENVSSVLLCTPSDVGYRPTVYHVKEKSLL